MSNRSSPTIECSGRAQRFRQEQRFLPAADSERSNDPEKQAGSSRGGSRLRKIDSAVPSASLVISRQL